MGPAEEEVDWRTAAAFRAGVFFDIGRPRAGFLVRLGIFASQERRYNTRKSVD